MHTYFPNVKVVTDKFHFVRETTESVDNIEDKLTQIEKKYFKHSKKLQILKYDKLNDDKQKENMLEILQISDKRKQ